MWTEFNYVIEQLEHGAEKSSVHLMQKLKYFIRQFDRSHCNFSLTIMLYKCCVQISGYKFEIEL